MNAPARIGVYAAGLAVVFGASAAVAGAVVPEQTVTAWTQSTQSGVTEEGGMEHSQDGEAGTEPVRGLSAGQDGYLLSEVSAPDAVGSSGELSFRITDDEGAPLTDYAASHEKELHLIVVRSDGTGFRHVHPQMDDDGVWSLPWTWDAAGTYRVYADFVPADVSDGPDVTLSRTVQVAGDYEPAPATGTSTTSSVDGFDVTLDGDLRAGATSELTVNVTRDGEPVTTLQPYLGAFGHLVALRDGDLAYLHVHPEGAEPTPGALSGPAVTFMTQAPTPGRYLLYLDFQVDGHVHTATFAVNTTEGAGSAGAGDHGRDDHGH
ncbi:hypothetical protein [Georgenia sp. SUBG003]|uniref:hypothetical protein n=1 Tax=Georgenia sp. SUBG003 TaxID=1497974 RepID=UPI0004D9B2DC|nr:hypothetical protein DA06_14670 [Georgenia sp. SUBG003]